MKAVEMIAVPDDASDRMTLAAAIDAFTDFMGVREFGPAKWQAMRNGEDGPSPEDSVWHGEFWLFISEVVRPFVIGLSVVGAEGFVHLVESDGSTCIIDGRPLASDAFARMSGDWNLPPDLSALLDATANAAADFLSFVSSDVQPAGKA